MADIVTKCPTCGSLTEPRSLCKMRGDERCGMCTDPWHGEKR